VKTVAKSDESVLDAYADLNVDRGFWSAAGSASFSNLNAQYQSQVQLDSQIRSFGGSPIVSDDVTPEEVGRAHQNWSLSVDWDNSRPLRMQMKSLLSTVDDMQRILTEFHDPVTTRLFQIDAPVSITLDYLSKETLIGKMLLLQIEQASSWKCVEYNQNNASEKLRNLKHAISVHLAKVNGLDLPQVMEVNEQVSKDDFTFFVVDSGVFQLAFRMAITAASCHTVRDSGMQYFNVNSLIGSRVHLTLPDDNNLVSSITWWTGQQCFHSCSVPALLAMQIHGYDVNDLTPLPGKPGVSEVLLLSPGSSRQTSCPFGQFAKGLLVQYSDSCGNKCYLDGNIMERVDLTCAPLPLRPVSGAVDHDRVIKNPIQPLSGIVVQAACDAGTFVSSVSVDVGSDCFDRCRYDGNAIAAIILHCKPAWDLMGLPGQRLMQKADLIINGATTTTTTTKCTCMEPGREPAGLLQRSQRANETSGERIINGREVQNYLWMARLVQDGKSYCGATIIGKGWIVTAAHCVLNTEACEPVEPTYHYFSNCRLPQVQFPGAPGQPTLNAKYVYVPADPSIGLIPWRPTAEERKHFIIASSSYNQADIALIQFEGLESFWTDPTSRVALARKQAQVDVDGWAPARAFGWGCTDGGKVNCAQPDHLMAANLIGITNQKCFNLVTTTHDAPNEGEFKERAFTCTERKRKTDPGTCNADSGGPLGCFCAGNPRKFILRGVLNGPLTYLVPNPDDKCFDSWITGWSSMYLLHNWICNVCNAYGTLNAHDCWACNP